MDLTVLTCNYNTPDLISNLKLSIEKFNPSLNLLVVDTSEQQTTQKDDSIQVISLPGASHGNGVNFGLGKINTKYCLLVDSDILFLKNIESLFDNVSKHTCAAAGKISKNRSTKPLYPRIDPWFMFIDVSSINKLGIKFFDEQRTKTSRTSGGLVYDVGSTFYEDLALNNLTVAEFDGEGKYFYHAEGLTWYTKKYNPNQEDTDIDFGGTHPHKAYYDLGLTKHKQYAEISKTILSS